MNPDFVDLLRAFIEGEVRFLVVGAYALAHHGRPRATGDLDVWVDPTAENAPRVILALNASVHRSGRWFRPTSLAQVSSFKWASRQVASTS